MAGFNDTGYGSFTPTEEIRLHQLVTRVAGGVRVCQAGETPVGNACRNGVAPGELAHEKISVAFRNKQGSHIAIANGVIAEGGEFESAADGKITALAGGTPLGFVNEQGGATADDHEVEIVYY